MRRLLVTIALSGCAFKSGAAPDSAPGTGTDGPLPDSQVIGDAGTDTNGSTNGSPDADTCTAPYTRTVNGCHAFNTVAATTWAQARQECQNRGGDLPIVNTLAESTYLATGTNGDANARVWIGLSGTSTDGSTWTWIDGMTVAQRGVTNWNTGEPSSGDTRGVIRPDGTWAGRGTADVFNVVCEK